MDLLAVPIGLLIGLSLGGLGGGGSILTVPALVYLLSQGTRSATTESLIIVGVSALAGAAVHYRAGRVRVREGVIFGVLGAGGSYAGSRLSASVDPHVLLAAFSALLLAVAVPMVRRRRSRAPDPVPVPSGGPGPVPGATEGGPAAAARGPVWVMAAATLVGLVTGFFGVGGGFVVVPALVLALGFSMPAAIGTSLLVIAINSASALLFRIGSHAHLHLSLLAVFTAATIAGTVAGAKASGRARPEGLVRAFAVLLVLVAVYTAARSVPHLV